MKEGPTTYFLFSSIQAARNAHLVVEAVPDRLDIKSCWATGCWRAGGLRRGVLRETCLFFHITFIYHFPPQQVVFGYLFASANHPEAPVGGVGMHKVVEVTSGGKDKGRDDRSAFWDETPDRPTSSMLPRPASPKLHISFKTLAKASHAKLASMR